MSSGSVDEVRFECGDERSGRPAGRRCGVPPIGDAVSVTVNRERPPKSGARSKFCLGRRVVDDDLNILVTAPEAGIPIDLAGPLCVLVTDSPLAALEEVGTDRGGE